MMLDAQTLATMGLIIAAIIQATKGVAFVKANKDVLPLVSLVVGGVVGYGASFVVGSVTPLVGIFAGLVASGGYDAISSTLNRVKSTRTSD